MTNAMPATLNADIFVLMQIFSHLSDHDQKAITGLVWARTLAPGHEICRQGDHADCMWLLGNGASLCATPLLGTAASRSMVSGFSQPHEYA